MEVLVIRSAKRRKTVAARLVGGVLHVRMPAWMGLEEEAHWVREMTRRFEGRRTTSTIDLAERAGRLADRYGLPRPETITWAFDQTARWGSCLPSEHRIRISHRLAPWPAYVLDYVIVHELAHLVEPNHGPRFHELESRFERAERAVGFLHAKGMTPEDEQGETG